MSIQEQPVCYNIPGQTTPSSIVINRGNEEYDPFTVDEEDLNESEQSKNQKQESIRINNGYVKKVRRVYKNFQGSLSTYFLS